MSTQKLNIAVSGFVPCDDTTDALASFIADHDAKKDKEVISSLVSSVNAQMKNNAVIHVVHDLAKAEDGGIFPALFTRVTYGRYKWTEAHGLEFANTIDKVITVGDKKVARSKFVTYADCVRYVNTYNKDKEHKNNGLSVALVNDLNADQVALFSVFGNFMAGQMDSLDPVDIHRVKRMAKYGDIFKAFTGAKDTTNKDKTAQAMLQILFDVLQGMAKTSGCKAIKRGGAENKGRQIWDCIANECMKYSSIYKNDVVKNEVQWISATFNEVINYKHGLVTTNALQNLSKTTDK